MSEPFAKLKQNIHAELMAAWRAGCRDGLVMAAKMAEQLAVHPGLDESQRAALGGLIAALYKASNQAVRDE